MRRLNKREQIMGAIIAFAVPLSYYSFVHQQQSAQISQIRSSVDTENTKLDQKQSELQTLILKAAASKKISSTGDEVTRYLEANKHMSNILRKLGADEQDHGMVVKNITVQKNEKVNNLYQSTMRVEVESSFVALGNFLGALNETDSLVDVKTVTLNRIDTDLKRCTATIEVNGYFNEGPKL